MILNLFDFYYRSKKCNNLFEKFKILLKYYIGDLNKKLLFHKNILFDFLFLFLKLSYVCYFLFQFSYSTKHTKSSKLLSNVFKLYRNNYYNNLQ